MKNMFVAVVFFFLVLVAWAKNDESDRSLPPVPPTVTEWTSVEEVPSIASSRIQVKLTSAPPSGLPDHLAIGSREELRKYIVGKNKMEMNVWLMGQYYNQTSYSQIQVGKWTEGYNSFEEFLLDATQGIQTLVPRIQSATNYKAGTDVLFSISVTYLNDHVGILKPLGLSIPRKQGTRETLSVPQIIDSFRSFQTNDFERLIVPIPPLRQLELVLVLSDGQIGSLTWTKESGAKLASWPKTQPEPITDLYFGMSGWLCGANTPLRIKLTPQQGEPETYTQYGDRLSLPTVVGMSARREFQINSAPKGADVEIWSSTNMVVWRNRGTVYGIVPPVSIPTLPSDGPMQFYKAIAR